MSLDLSNNLKTREV